MDGPDQMDEPKSPSLSDEAITAIRDMLDGFGVPRAAFIDDHVMNGLAWARMKGLEEAAGLVDQKANEFHAGAPDSPTVGMVTNEIRNLSVEIRSLKDKGD